MPIANVRDLIPAEDFERIESDEYVDLFDELEEYADFLDEWEVQ